MEKNLLLLRYVTFSILALFSALMLVQAGKDAFFHPSAKNEKLFKSYHDLKKDLKDPNEAVETQNDIQVLPVENTDAEKKKNEDEKKSLDEKNEKKSSLDEKTNVAVDESEKKMTPLRDMTSDMVHVLVPAPSKAPDQRNFRERIKNIPNISAVFIPAFETQQGLAVVERQVSSDQGMVYEVQQYDASGTKYLGSWLSPVAQGFPFQHNAKFVEVMENAFMQSSKFFVFDDVNSSDVQKVLSYQPLVTSLIENSSQPSFDEKTYLGKDPQDNFKLYQLFPGIYSAQMILP